MSDKHFFSRSVLPFSLKQMLFLHGKLCSCLQQNHVIFIVSCHFNKSWTVDFSANALTSHSMLMLPDSALWKVASSLQRCALVWRVTAVLPCHAVSHGQILDARRYHRIPCVWRTWPPVLHFSKWSWLWPYARLLMLQKSCIVSLTCKTERRNKIKEEQSSCFGFFFGFFSSNLRVGYTK